MVVSDIIGFLTHTPRSALIYLHVPHHISHTSKLVLIEPVELNLVPYLEIIHAWLFLPFSYSSKFGLPRLHYSHSLQTHHSCLAHSHITSSLGIWDHPSVRFETICEKSLFGFSHLGHVLDISSSIVWTSPMHNREIQHPLA